MTRMLIAAAIAALVSTAFAAMLTNCPHPDLCFRLEYLDATSASKSCYMLVGISAPITYNVTLGHHNRERDYDDFIQVYPNAEKSNFSISRITGSTKSGFDPTCERLPSAGVKDGKMAADMRCSICTPRISDPMDLFVPAINVYWNWAYVVTDVSGYMVGSGANAFGTPPSYLLRQYKHLVSRWAPAAGHAGRFGPPPRIIHMALAHGVLACIAWALIFPLSGILVRSCSFHNLLWVHTALQIVGLCLYTASIGLGIQLGMSPFHHWMKDKHVIIGLAVYGLFLTQAASGYIHHVMFKKYISRTTSSYIHLWTGRLCITLAMINGGFGFQLRSQKIGSWKVALYTVCAVVMWCAYVTSIVIGEWRRNKQMKKVASSTSLSQADSCIDIPTVREIPKQV
ncbi:integral membrane protein [Paraphaeosphaeria sporulosa]